MPRAVIPIEEKIADLFVSLDETRASQMLVTLSLLHKHRGSLERPAAKAPRVRRSASAMSAVEAPLHEAAAPLPVTVKAPRRPRPSRRKPVQVPLVGTGDGTDDPGLPPEEFAE